MPITSIPLHVNGPAIIQVGTTGGTLSRLGVSDSGIDLNFTAGFEPVMVDDTFSWQPNDLQFGGFLCSISFRMIRWTESVLERLRARLPSGTTGTIRDADYGTLLFTAGETWTVYIESAARTGLAAELPWTFTRCVPTEAFGLSLGTRHSRAPGGFTCYPNSSGVLYTRG